MLMNWIKEHINSIELFLFCWVGISNIIHGWLNENTLQIQVGFLFLCIGYLDCVRDMDR